MKGKNMFLVISFILGVCYCVYLFVYFLGDMSSSDGMESAGAAIASVLVMPHLICTVLATLFNGLGCFLNKRGFALTGGILYIVAMVMMPIYFMFVIIQAILSFIGFAKMKGHESHA